MTRSFILTLSCPNRTGIVRAVSAFLFEHGCDISEYQQFDDPVSGRLFLRTRADVTCSDAEPEPDLDAVSRAFADVATEFGMDYQFSDGAPARILVMVSKLGHCLNDLIYRWRAGSLGAEIVAVVSNHEDLRPMAESAGLPYVHIPVTADTKPDAEAQLLATADAYDAELVVLARYMQVLSDETCKALYGRAINIHHSFLPGFKGARPYHQAYGRGVKLVGATAHYVTPDLDEGPIIEQEVIRIDHTYDPSSLQMVGRDAEALALSRAVRWHCERRVLLSGTSTVVFR
ncbi:formyltetrahydrofolate deformylase [Pseudonocardia phyllosphaerae]|uniref:formyltetrahydrofolate deformylase n=1 Tax=Pseudonocardia phyllosphaerae TaxID=3390502 RepID=UPI00397E847B